MTDLLTDIRKVLEKLEYEFKHGACIADLDRFANEILAKLLKQRSKLKAQNVDCPAHNLIGDLHYCGIGAEGDLLCYKAYHHPCNWYKDRPDREKLADIIFPFRWFFSNNRDDALDLADQLLLLYPDVEYLLKQLHLADTNYSKLKSTFDERIEEAKREERERITGMMSMRDVGGINPEWALSDKDYQALKGE